MSTKNAQTWEQYGDPATLPNVNIDPKSPEAAPYHRQYGKELVNSALWGLGLGAGGTALYHLINGANSSQLSELRGLINNPAPATALKEKPTKSKKKKAPKAESAGDMQLKFSNDASASNLMDNVYTSLGKLVPTQYIPETLWSTPRQDAAPNLNTAHAGWRQAANIIAAMGGGYGGMRLVNSLSDNKRKKDIEDEVESARNAYFAALTGKEAQVLDDVFETVKKAAGEEAPTIWNLPKRFMGGVAATPGVAQHAAQDAKNLAWTSALLTALGTGAIGAKYMYDQTKARTQAENLMRARNSKARLQMLNQTPYVDPDELAAFVGR